MYKEHITLQTALTMPLNQSFRLWEVPGLHISVKNLPGGATVLKTFVMQLCNHYMTIGIEFTLSGDLGTSFGNISGIAKASSLEELRKEFPQLFELEGTLYAFS